MYDDGFTAYVNGVEVARRNVDAGGDAASWALGSIEPVREEIEIGPAAAPVLLPGENVLALSFHNASATSSDLSADPALRAFLRDRGHEFLIPPGAVWHYRPCGQTADARWHTFAFDATGRRAAAEFTLPGSYVFAVRAETAAGLSAPATATVLVLPPGGSMPFVRGDANSDGAVDVADAVTILEHLFAGGAAPCRSALDTNNSAGVDIADAVYLLAFLFSHGPPPPPPTPPACGFPPEPDGLGCLEPAPRCLP
jgi:hypothetical protein